MTKKRVSMGILALLLVLGISLSGCKTIDSVSGGVDNPRMTFFDIGVPAKDFQALGLVFAEASYDEDTNGSRGDVLTYQALLKEAKALGADYIVNVVIDSKNEGSQKYLFGRPIGRLTQGKVTWYGSATAIKYTNIITNTKVVLDDQGRQSTEQTTTIMPSSSGNSGGLFGGGGFFSKFKKK